MTWSFNTDRLSSKSLSLQRSVRWVLTSLPTYPQLLFSNLGYPHRLVAFMSKTHEFKSMLHQYHFVNDSYLDLNRHLHVLAGYCPADCY